MKLKSLLMAFLMLVACEPGDLTEKFVSSDMEEVANPNVLSEAESIEEVDRSLNQLILGENHHTALRSRYKESVDCTVSTRGVKVSLNRRANARRAYQTVPVHTIEYKNNEGGFVGRAVTIADRRFADKVIAFIEDADVDLYADDEGGFWEDRIEGYIHRMVNEQEASGELKSVEDYVDLLSSETPVFFHHQLDVRYNWHQLGTPFTDYTPFRNGVRAAAGCNAVAMGMIMAWHQWPLQGNYPRYEKEPNGIVVQKDQYPVYKEETWALFHPDHAAGEIPSTDPLVSEHIADLLAEIGYKMNTDYVSETSANIYPDFACSVFPQMGYYCNEEFGEFDAAAIVEEIDEERPVFMAGLRQGGYGHSAVISGVVTWGEHTGNIAVDTGDAAYIYILNGNAGDGDGWYSVSLFSSNTVTLGDDKATFFVYPYRYKCKILTHIRPDYTNAGSKERWRVSSLRPY